ncbi:GNAT family N-acetyltransferase [Promineifilum sp.]|uniref:GNAT family N-acetyltransferase n=1 Tax=Promineifilum sp. TaxID=2664178 RepID=UPI0035B45EE2
MITSNLLRGEQVRLTAVTAGDMPAITRWWADPDFLRLYNTAPAAPRNEDQLSRRFDLSQTSPDVFLFAVRLLDEEEIVGLLEFDGVDWSNRTTFVSIGIGEARHRGQGYGRDAMAVGLRFAFHELNLHRVCLTVFGYNAAAIALYERLGFTREGVYREHIERDGRRYDMLLYGLLRREWEKTQGSRGAGEQG